MSKVNKKNGPCTEELDRTEDLTLISVCLRLIVYTEGMESTAYIPHPLKLLLHDTNPSPRFGKNVRRYRRTAKLTQEELGELSGLDRAYISGVERAVRNPTVVNVERIAAALQVQAGKLFE